MTALAAENDGRIAVLSPEGGVLSSMGGRYQAKGKPPNIQFCLMAHAGDTVRVDRTGRPPDFIDKPALTLGLTVQEEVIRALADNPGFRGLGLWARFLYTMPMSLVGCRDLDPPPVRREVADGYRTRMRGLLAQPFGTDDDGRPDAHIITLAPGAYEVWLEFARWVEPQLADLGPMAHIGDWGGKLPGAVARIAGLLHVADRAGTGHPWATPMPAATMRRAVVVGRYLIPHAQAAFFAMGADPAISQARYVLKWIRAHGGGGFTKKQCFDGTKGRFKQVEELEPALALLEKHGYIRKRKAQPRQGRGRPPSPGYDVNPATLRDEVRIGRIDLAMGVVEEAVDPALSEAQAGDSASPGEGVPAPQDPPQVEAEKYEEELF